MIISFSSMPRSSTNRSLRFRNSLTAVRGLFPFPQGGEIDNPYGRRLGASYLRQALVEERKAIEAIRAALSRL